MAARSRSWAEGGTRSWTAWRLAFVVGLLVQVGLPDPASPQTVLGEALVAVDGEVLHRIDDVDVTSCLWMSTYNVHGEPAPAGDSVGSVRFSFYVRGEPTTKPLAARDGSDARFHTRVVIGANPTSFYRKGAGWAGSFERNATLSELGELALSTLGIPTRVGPTGIETREFTADDASRIKDLYGSWANCLAEVTEYARHLATGSGDQRRWR